LQEYLIEGIVVTIIGISIVMAVLCIIAFILNLFAKFNMVSEDSKKNKSIALAETEIKTQPVETVKIIEETDNNDDLELIAVITAAIAESMNTSVDNLFVRSIKKVTLWNEQAKNEQQNRRFF